MATAPRADACDGAAMSVDLQLRRSAFDMRRARDSFGPASVRLANQEEGERMSKALLLPVLGAAVLGFLVGWHAGPVIGTVVGVLFGYAAGTYAALRGGTGRRRAGYNELLTAARDAAIGERCTRGRELPMAKLQRSAMTKAEANDFASALAGRSDATWNERYVSALRLCGYEIRPSNGQLDPGIPHGTDTLREGVAYPYPSTEIERASHA